ncbi:hypothetical protein HPULCUR_005772 [Helicostylum pulchrum]|uniref:Uncharacterized protein n=1 Tax=Helicostylum pulchrum TaxID=562976 RepID=A0ABP9Y1A9_9FUNG
MGDNSTRIYYEFEDYDYFGDFITSRYVKGYWTAFYALCLYWGFFWFSRHIFGDGNNHMFSREEATRLNRTCNSLRDITLLLLSALVINTMARGGKRSVMILAWIYFVMAVIWSIYEMISSHHLARLSSSIVFYGICITIGAIAFQKGFDEFD